MEFEWVSKTGIDGLSHTFAIIDEDNLDFVKKDYPDTKVGDYLCMQVRTAPYLFVSTADDLARVVGDLTK